MIGTFQADNIMDARHVEAAATTLALLTIHALDGYGEGGGREKGAD